MIQQKSQNFHGRETPQKATLELFHVRSTKMFYARKKADRGRNFDVHKNTSCQSSKWSTILDPFPGSGPSPQKGVDPSDLGEVHRPCRPSTPHKFLLFFLPIYRSTDLPIYRPTDLPIYRSTDLPIYRPTDLPIGRYNEICTCTSIQYGLIRASNSRKNWTCFIAS